ncbi:uncharacterized protein LOC128276916 [Anopheles cruzii]|uniref:uncharacterized protein LOC128276916 n=1 Tax=Anopheles cruzii TaxID=68878 RepID=UPI0022EC9279|nr:uncharacterized protein LOC128276916 [Anopheles cruzii]
MNAESSPSVCRCCSTALRESTDPSIDLLKCPEINRMLKQLYPSKDVPGDEHKLICMACYLNALGHSNFVAEYRQKRKTFRMNQLVLYSQTCPSPPPPLAQNLVADDDNKSDDGDENANPEEISPQISVESSENFLGFSDPNDVPDNEEQPTTVEEPSNDEVVASARASTSTSAKNGPPIMELRPVLVDCLKTPMYLESLAPVTVTVDPAHPKITRYLCGKCFAIFDHLTGLKVHEKHNRCHLSCRYCLTRLREGKKHRCEPQEKYAPVLPLVRGNRYRHRRSEAAVDLTSFDESTDTDDSSDSDEM